MSGQSPYMSAAQYGYSTNFPQRDARYASNSSVETAMVLNRRPSLLAGYHNHFSSPERTSVAPYYLSVAPVSMGPHADDYSKRSRYSSANSQLLPLSIDIKKEQPLYQPQTEAISPILDEPKIDSHMRDTTIIRNSISKLESDIEITVKKLHRAKLSQNEIRSQADKSAADEEDNNDHDDLLKANGSQTLIEKILYDNRKTAEDGQKVLNQLNNNMDLTIPLYQEPNDLESIDKIRIQYMNVMKNRLVNSFKKSRERYMIRTKFESEKYDQTYRQWQKSIEKEEKLILAKDTTTYRDTFEKTFSELRKAREDKEKKQTTNDSSTEQQISLNPNPIEQEIVAGGGGGGEEEGDEKMRKSSIIPPIMYDSWQRKHQYFNQNGLIRDDAALFYKEHTKMPCWSTEERQIFVEKFTQSPKNFGYISSFLENKTTEQCIQYYYMTKKTENYKNLLRKLSQANKRKAKQNTTTMMTTTTVTSSTTIETTLVTKVTSLNTIVSSTSQQNLAFAQNAERAINRIDNGEERRDIDSGETNEEKRSNKNRCQLLSCTTEKLGKKKNRKNRLRAFPPKWNELTKEHHDEISRLLQIPKDVQRCCIRCYEKLIQQIRQRQTNPTLEEEEEDDDNETNSKPDEKEWTETEIDAFTQALDKFNHDWTQIAEHVHRSEHSCRAFYLKQRKNPPIDDDQEDNGSISGSELGQIKANNDDDVQKTNINEDSNDSAHAMVIDESEEQNSIIPEEKTSKIIPSTTNLTTITSLVEKEISKTLNQSEKRPTNNIHTSPERPINNTQQQQQPPPLVAAAATTKSNSPATHFAYPSHAQQQYLNKGSIMRGTPISSSIPTNKPIAVDISQTHSHPHHYTNPRNDYTHLKSPKILDRNIEQQQQQHLLQQQHAAYMRHYSHQQPPPPPPSATQYLQQQQQQQHKTSATKIDPPSTNTFETLRADYVTSKYLTTTHSPSHERQHRIGPDQRSPPQPSPSIGQSLLPPPSTITSSTSNPSIQPSPHSHHSQKQAVLLAASQLLASSGMYPQDLLASGLLPYAPYYTSLSAGSPFIMDPRVMHDYAAAAANNEQLKAEHHKEAMRLSRYHHHPQSVTGHSPPDPSYPSHSSKRHSHDNIGYPTGDYPASIWRTQNMNSSQPQQQQVHSQMKSNPDPLLKINDFSRHSATRVTPAADRNSRSPDDYHHRVSQSRTAVESPSVHFQRVEAHNHHKSSHEKPNSNLHFTEHSTDGNPLNYMRQPTNMHKSQASQHSPHRHHQHNSNATNRTLIPPLQNSQISPHHPAYMHHNVHHSPVGTVSPQQRQQSHYSQHQQRTAPHPNESIRSTKESMSIQEFMNKTVNEFVGSTNNDNKTSTTSDLPLHETPTSRIQQLSNSDQPILIDGDDDSNPIDQSETTNKLVVVSEMLERRRESSIKKILSNQPLEKQEYDEINQKVQHGTVGASKVHSNTEQQTHLERSNSASGRAKSRGSITMRMLMGANEVYVDGKAQPMGANDEGTNKRSGSPNKCEKIDYLIRDELDRACPALIKRDESVFHKLPQNTSKRMRTLPKDEEHRPSSFQEPITSIPDPFALQPHSKNQLPATSSSDIDRNWQSYVQQQYHQLPNCYSSPFTSRASRPTGSITQGSPVSSSARLSTDQQQYPSATNNQLVNPRYSHQMNKNEQQHLSSTSPHEYSPKAKIARRANPTPSSDTQHDSSISTSVDPSSSLKSPPITTTTVSNTPPSPPTPSVHSLKKRLISEYELEQQRNSPVVSTPTTPPLPSVSEAITTNSNVNIPKTETEVAPETVEETENLT